MTPGAYQRLAAMVRQKREQAVQPASYQTHMSQRLTAYLKESHARTLETVKLHGWWEYNNFEEVREIVIEELYELADALKRHDFDGPHGVRSESYDCLAVISKLLIWADNRSERGEI